MSRYTVTYKGEMDPQIDEALREAIPGWDGSGCMLVAEPPLRDNEFTNTWDEQAMIETARQICGNRFVMVVSYD